MRLIRVAGLASLLSLVLASSSFVVAQATAGRILGRVTDPSGAVIAGAKVELVNEQTGVVRATATSNSGGYLVTASD